VDSLRRRYGRQVAFFHVYVREAHPEDGWVVTENREAGIAYRDPASTAERAELARTCTTRLRLGLPVLVDDLDDRVARAYGGWPERLYLIGADGRIAYQGGPGPWEFRPEELGAAIVRKLGRPTKSKREEVSQPGDR
jgi:hypothetical protein